MSTTWTARTIRDRVAAGETTATEVCQTYLDRIAAHGERLNAFISVGAEQALARAADIDRRRAELSHLPLLGVPIAIKDTISTRVLRTTAGSRLLAQYTAPYDATVIARLDAAGAIVLGKTNCDEFAMGSSNENSAFGPVRNPWDVERTPGGSSGGSAAAVAAGLAPVALGSDTGGSVRQPAGLCGVVGLKPTYGRVSRYGLLAFGSSLDQIGTFSRTVEDAALVLSAIAGADPADATTVSLPVPDESAMLDTRGAPMRIGVPRALLEEGLDAPVRAAVLEALAQLEARGATLVDIALPHSRYAIPVYYLVATAEASSNLARYDGVRYTSRAALAAGEDLGTMYRRTRDEGFGDEVKRRIMLGTYVLSAGYYDAYYLKAQQVRTLIRQDYERAFEQVDAIATPTSPTAAFRLGEKMDDPLQMYLGDIFTVSANLAGLPGVSVPCGFTDTRLPIGLQLVGRAFDESSVLRIAHAYQQITDWHLQAPALA